MPVDQPPPTKASVRCGEEREEAIRRPKDQRSLEIGELRRVIGTGEEVEIVDIESVDGGEAAPTVVWVPAGVDDEPEHRRTNPANEVV